MDEVPTPAAAPEAKPRKKRRWRWRFLRWSALILIVGVGGVWIFRVRIANAILASAAKPFALEVGELDWERGGVKLKNVVLRMEKSGTVLARIPEAHVEAKSWDAINGKLGKVMMDHPEITLGQEFWDEIFAPAAPGSAPPPNPSSLAFQTDAFDIKNAKITVLGANGAKSYTDVNWQGSKATFYLDGSVALDRQKLQLKNVGNETGKAGEKSLQMAGAEVDFSVDRESRLLTIHHLKSGRTVLRAFAEVWKQLGWESPATPASAPTPSPPSLTTSRQPVERIEFGDVQLQEIDFQFDSFPGMPGWPGISGRLTASADHAAFGGTGSQETKGVSILVEDLTFGNSPATALAIIPRLEAKVAATESVTDWRILSLSARSANLRLSPELMKAYPALSGMLGNLPIPKIDTRCSVEIRNLLVGAQGLKSGEVQEIRLDSFQASTPADEPILSFASLLARGVPDEVLGARRLRDVIWLEPRMQIDANILTFLTRPGAPVENAPSPPPLDPIPAIEPTTPPWEGWMVDHLEISAGKIAATNLGPGRPNMSANFSGLTEQREVGGELLHRFRVTAMLVENPRVVGQKPIYKGASLTVDIHPVRFWADQEIDAVTLEGSDLQVGEALSDLQSQATPTLTYNAAGGGSAAPGSPPEKIWKIREATLSQTLVSVYGIIPQAGEILLPLSRKTLTDIPLDLKALSLRQEVIKLELPKVHIPGPRPNTTVAMLDTVWLEFTLKGLFEHRIDTVILGFPSIFVGDNLFHYIEIVRQQNANASPALSPGSAERFVALDPFSMMLNAITYVFTETLEKSTNVPWSVDRLRAANGKLIFTLKDSPVESVPPLPFGADSNLKDGVIKADLAIPPGLYKPVKGIPLEVQISEGKVEFNLPKKGESNNLYQEINAEWLQYKQFRLTGVRLQVTYDAGGIYMKFEASAYGGYVKGIIDVYFDSVMSWDVYVEGWGLDMKALTDKLTADTFRMSGKVNVSAQAQGDQSTLYSASGKLESAGGGEMTIVALNDFINSLPTDWEELQRSLTKLGLETVRDFKFNTCTGDFRFYGMEGVLKLLMKGPSGKREIEIHSHER